MGGCYIKHTTEDVIELAERIKDCVEHPEKYFYLHFIGGKLEYDEVTKRFTFYTYLTK